MYASGSFHAGRNEDWRIVNAFKDWAAISFILISEQRLLDNDGMPSGLIDGSCRNGVGEISFCIGHNNRFC